MPRQCGGLYISIHALREEGDLLTDFCDYHKLISIHALREEGDATDGAITSQRNDFNPRPPRGGRRCRTWRSCLKSTISIHALREEGDGLPQKIKEIIK